jgi:hypothetical protein
MIGQIVPFPGSAGGGGGAPALQNETLVSAAQVPSSADVAWPSGIASDDVAVLFASYALTSALPSITVPSGWTEVENDAPGGSVTYVRHAVWWKRLDGTETGNVTVGCSPTSASSFASHTIHLSIWRGCKTSADPVEQSGTAMRNATLASAGTPIRQVAAPDRTLLHFYTLGVTSVTAGPGFSQRFTTFSGNQRRAMSVRAMTTPGYLGEEVACSSTSPSWGSIYLSLVPKTETSPSTPAQDDAHLGSVVFLSSFEGADAQTNLMDAVNPSRIFGRTTAAEIDTAQVKFGASSFRRASGFMSTPDTDEWAFGSDPFTLECWVRFNTAPTSSFHYLVAQYDTGASQRSWALLVNAGALQMLLSTAGTSGTAVASAAWSPSTGVWYHVVGEWDGTNYRTYVDGSMLGKSGTAVTPLLDSTAALTIGAALNSGAVNSAFDGWLDELRITKGVARYASDSGFTVPAAAFPRD